MRADSSIAVGVRQHRRINPNVMKVKWWGLDFDNTSFRLGRKK
jgi:hypothetical protein